MQQVSDGSNRSILHGFSTCDLDASTGGVLYTYVEREMESIMRTFHFLQGKIESAEETSSSSILSTLQIPGEILNDFVYQVYKPTGSPSVEIVFFHGLNLDGATDAHWRTWLSKGGSKLWLEWIWEKDPHARLLLVSYDAFARRTSNQGHMDMTLTSENLVQDLIEAQVGQGDCSVVLVGHSIGCLVMKELCTRLDSNPNPSEREQNLLFNVKGLFYYACPHHGSEMVDRSTGFAKGLLFEELTTLNTVAQRRNENFRRLREKYRWGTYGIQEGLPTTLEGFEGFIVQEASARHDVDGFYTDRTANHFTICQPESTTSSSFRLLLNFIADVLEKDKEEASPRFDIPNRVGLGGRVMTLIEKLKGTQRLGIVGMGGIGKTTLAMALYNTILRKFEYSCFLTGVKEFVTKKGNQTLLREKITEGLCRRGRQVEKPFNWGKLNGKKVVIVLDDVEFRFQVQVMMKSDGLSKDSRLIVTSRDSGFLIGEGFDCYTVEPLGRRDSNKLFCLNAFNTENIPNDFKEGVTSFVQKCEGLPLALTVVAKYLFAENDRKVWDDVLENLRRAQSFNGSQEDELWSVLRVSYDCLAAQEKQMFLDVATCFHGEDLELVKQVWRVCGWAPSPDSGLRNLLRKGLVTIQEDFQSQVIRMHEVLRALGQSIACPDPENVASHTRLFCNWLNLLPTTWPFDQGNAEVKILKIVYSNSEYLSTERLHGLKDLRVLCVGFGVTLHGPCNLLPPKLAYIQFCCGRSAQPESLQSSLSDRVGVDVRRTLNLVEADLSSERLLHTLGDLEGLQSLVTYLDDCKTLPESLWKLRALKFLVVRSCSKLKAVPDGLGDLQSLENLRLLGCSLTAIPKTLVNLRYLKHLVIECCDSVTAIPDSIGELTSLEHLVLQCGCLKALSECLGKLRDLRLLELRCCHDWKGLSVIGGQLRALQKLVMSRGCKVPANIELGSQEFDSDKVSEFSKMNIQGQLEFLESLKVRKLLQAAGQIDLPMWHETSVEIALGKGLGALPDGLENLRALENLSVSNCPVLDALIDSLQELPRLKRLSSIAVVS
ncbi:unnamed protein product [Calypogeia fissa]